jgi:hypothetical protein
MPNKTPVGKLTGDMTSAQFDRELAGLTSLTAEEVDRLCPTPADRAELLQLLRIVRSSADDNTKKAALVDQIASVSGVILRIAARVAAV